MDRLRFRRGSRKEASATPPATSDGKSSGKTTPEPAVQGPLSIPQVPSKKPSPFRALHFSRSAKRARSPPPASLPHSPNAALHPHDAYERPPSSPLSLRKETSAEETTQTHEYRRQPKIPAFLTLTSQEIDQKFQEIVWLERNRLMQSIQNNSPDFKWARVTGPHLKRLDRYMNVQPWHNNRVKLKVPPGRVDYINASPIELSSPEDKEPDRYIAMQGPKEASTDHVWRMIVEQLESPGVIVMLTETHEGNMEKCYPYFPRNPDEPPLEVNERDEFGDGFRASVRCEGLEETPAGDAIELRKLVIRVYSRSNHTNGTNGNGTNGHVQADENGDITMLSPGKIRELDDHTSIEDEGVADVGREDDVVEERIIWHFLYKKWPDFGVPALEDLESFFTLMRLSREKNAGPRNPRIVHCSAGVGRSGTFIALEHLIRELDAGRLEHYDSAPPTHETEEGYVAVEREQEREDMVFNTVNQLREQRRNMVQAESQFLFIYQVMRKLWQDKYGEDEEDDEPAAKRLEFDPFVEETILRTIPGSDD